MENKKIFWKDGYFKGNRHLLINSEVIRIHTDGNIYLSRDVLEDLQITNDGFLDIGYSSDDTIYFRKVAKGKGYSTRFTHFSKDGYCCVLASQVFITNFFKGKPFHGVFKYHKDDKNGYFYLNLRTDKVS